MDDLDYGLEDASKKTGVGYFTLIRWVKGGRLPYRKAGHIYLVKIRDVLAAAMKYNYHPAATHRTKGRIFG